MDSSTNAGSGRFLSLTRRQRLALIVTGRAWRKRTALARRMTRQNRRKFSASTSSLKSSARYKKLTTELVEFLLTSSTILFISSQTIWLTKSQLHCRTVLFCSRRWQPAAVLQVLQWLQHRTAVPPLPSTLRYPSSVSRLPTAAQRSCRSSPQLKRKHLDTAVLEVSQRPFSKRLHI